MTNSTRSDSIIEELVGHSIESFGYEDGVIYLTDDDGKVWMFQINENDELYIELYEYGLQ